MVPARSTQVLPEENCKSTDCSMVVKSNEDDRRAETDHTAEKPHQGRQRASWKNLPMRPRCRTHLSIHRSAYGDDIRKRLHHQFIRLDSNGTGRLDDKDFESLLIQQGDMELTDLSGMLDYLYTLTHKDDVEFDEFVLLVTDERLRLPPTPRSVQADVAILREVLRLEEQSALYLDEETLTLQKTWTDYTLEYGPAIVIATNTLTIGLSSDIAPDAWAWQIVEMTYLFLYTLEACAKMWIYGVRWYFRGPDYGWNYFDFFCLMLSAVDVSISLTVHLTAYAAPPTGVLMLVKLLRLSRLARLVRTLRFDVFKELKLMVMGVISGMRVLSWAMVLLIVFIYICGVAFNNILGGQEPEFGDVIGAMFTLFRCFTDGCTDPQGRPLTDRLAHRYGFVFMLCYLVMFMVIVLGVFNLIMAVFIDNVVSSQIQRKLMELAQSEHVVELQIKQHLLRLLLAGKAAGVPQEVVDDILDLEESLPTEAARACAQFQCVLDAAVIITRPMFRAFMEDTDFCECLVGAEIEVNHGADFLYTVLDADMSGWITAREIFDGLMMLRGPVNKAEVVSLRLQMRHICKMLHAHGMTEAHE
eukprot:TRINITY_DN41556_c0_g1_i1.p1 TRINITY_DN41556_c0_g1~~TRINITY_DN41556_c0_g1_i1.p1  ORF type:complete len:673 (-),score=102.25 TRINITY_DN41556_c0_g1_i1:21-1778(-)